MHRSLSTAAAVAVICLAAGCGGSSGGSGGSAGTVPNSTVCKRIQADIRTLASNSSSAGGLKAVASTLRTGAGRLDRDVADAKDAKLRNAVHQVTNALRQASASLDKGQNPTLGSLATKLGSAQQQVRTSCPSLAPPEPTSTSSPSAPASSAPAPSASLSPSG